MQQITLTSNSIYWGDFCWGKIIFDKSIFSLVRRTKRNIFHLYGDGLGFNSQALELLDKLNIQFIEGRLSGKSFRVSVKSWIEKGIKSPFTSGNVDPQTILKLSYIFPDDSNISQLSLFGRA